MSPSPLRGGARGGGSQRGHTSPFPQPSGACGVGVPLLCRFPAPSPHPRPLPIQGRGDAVALSSPHNPRRVLCKGAHDAPFRRQVPARSTSSGKRSSFAKVARKHKGSVDSARAGNPARQAVCGDRSALRRERIANSERTYNVASPIRHSLFAFVRQEEQGVQARARWPLTLIAWGAKNALLGRLRRPPRAWIGRSTGYRRGLGGSTLPHSRLRAGAWTVYPPTSRRTGPRHPGSR